MDFPTRRVGAAAVFLDDEGRVLALKPTYRPEWVLPGGLVEANETPREGCLRELKEELGNEFELDRLLCVEHTSPHADRPEGIMFVFLGKQLTAEDEARITLATDEVSELEFLQIEEALDRLVPRLGRRLRVALRGLRENRIVYSEDGEEPFPSDPLGLVDRTVRLVEYDQGWPDAYAEEEEYLRDRLNDLSVEIAHIGSTSVPGLCAKPIIDVAIGAAGNQEPVIDRLRGSARYEYRGFREKGGHIFVRWAGSLRTHHFHVVPLGGDQWFAYLRFRDLLRRDASARDEYARVKQGLANRYPNDRVAYLDGKDDVVTNLLKRNG